MLHQHRHVCVPFSKLISKVHSQKRKREWKTAMFYQIYIYIYRKYIQLLLYNCLIFFHKDIIFCRSSPSQKFVLLSKEPLLVKVPATVKWPRQRFRRPQRFRFENRRKIQRRCPFQPWVWEFLRGGHESFPARKKKHSITGKFKKNKTIPRCDHICPFYFQTITLDYHMIIIVHCQTGLEVSYLMPMGLWSSHRTPLSPACGTWLQENMLQCWTIHQIFWANPF